MLDLPDEGLSRVFARLPPACLRFIRLVCRNFRAASLPNIRTARVSTTCLSMARRQLQMLPPSATVSGELHSADGTALACLRTAAPKICRLHICAACDGKGCQTHAVLEPKKFAASRKFVAFTATFAQASRLTSLHLDSCEALAAPLVDACPHLQALVLINRDPARMLTQQS